jgi:hypothetical protein
MDLVRVHRRRKSTAPLARKPVVEEEAEKPSLTEPTSAGGAVRGEVKYPWGAVAQAAITLGEKFTRTDENGKYEILTVVPGTHSLSAKAPFPGYESVNQTITLALGETKTVDLYLDFEKTIVEGYVYDQDNKPLVGASLSGVMSGKDMESTVTDQNGHFIFERATPGNRFVRANAQGYMGQTRDFIAKVGETTSLEFRMTLATCKVYGTVTDTNGNPVRAEVHLSKSSIIVQRTWSDNQTGQYEFPVVPGAYDILASSTGHSSKGSRANVTADTKVDFVLVTLPKAEVGK